MAPEQLSNREDLFATHKIGLRLLLAGFKAVPVFFNGPSGESDKVQLQMESNPDHWTLLTDALTT